MGALSDNHEIVEVRDSEPHISRNAGKQDLKMPSNKYSIEDDINKLFESIDISYSRRGVGQHGQHVRYASHKNAMKRPMRVGSPQVTGIGISESVSLKQALRGLCISQASEMAAIKKRISRISAPPGFLETETIKSLYEAVVIEAGGAGRALDDGKGNLVEISLLPETSSLNISEKVSESGYASNSEKAVMMMEGVITPLPNIVGSAFSRSESLQSRTLGSPYSLDNSRFLENLPIVDEIVPISGEGSTEVVRHKEQVDNINSASSSLFFNAKKNPINTSKQGSGSSKKSLRTRSFLKKKLVSKTNITKIRQEHNEGPNNDNYATSVIGSDTPCSIPEKGCGESLVPCVIIGEESEVRKASERCRDQADTSQSSKSTIQEHSSTSYSEDSYVSGSSRSGHRPHMSRDLRWEAINSVRNQYGSLGLRHFKLLRKLGGGDIGSVYLSELIGTSCLFAVKVMDNDFLVSKKKMLRAQTEKEILEMLDHPFLPTLYAYFTTIKYSCFVMEYCPGGDLHVLRQKQPTTSFSEQAARFYVAEVLLALEYLHMLGVVYRDLKPENVLVREDGHIMLSDFDLSLRCAVNPMLLRSTSVAEPQKMSSSSPCSGSSCINPFCLQPSWQLPCFTPRFLSATAKTKKLKSELVSQVIPLPQLIVEPTSARSNSFVGTHEYLAPEIIKGEGHGSAVDWWMFGIFLYELLYGKTPFKGSNNEDTISNVVSQPLKFPECPMVRSSNARDLIKRLLKKEPENRLGSTKGAADVKEHPFFEGLNWALIRCEKPPEVPRFFDLGNVIPDNGSQSESSVHRVEFEARKGVEFEMF